MKRAIATLVMTTFVVVALAGQTACAGPWTPIEWKDGGKLRNWVRDRNGNFIDDLIEGRTGQVEVVVDLNRCIGNPDTSDTVRFLNTVGDVVYVGKYVTFVCVVGVPVNRVADIAKRPEVAMVELATEEKWLGDNFRAARIEDSVDYRPDTLEGRFGWPTSVNGTDVGIAFLDSGVGPAYDGQTTFGYDAISDAIGNPPPEATFDHATWMASWVFQTGAAAPLADLIDIKVGDSSGPDASAVMRGLEKVCDMHRTWNVNVVTMMLSGNSPLDGQEARQKLIDMLTARGIVVVAAAGSNVANTAVTGPGAATRAVGIAAADLQGTVDRTDDQAPLTVGPRADDGDADELDELKPEVIMPTGDSSTVLSNSIATAITSGLVGLAMQQNPQLRDFDNKASGSVKDLLIRSAEPKGGASVAIRYPQSTATWNERWGFGEIDAFKAFRGLSGQEQVGQANLTFLGFDGSSHPSPTWYYSLAVETQSERDGENITAGVADRIFARVQNRGPRDANRVRVSFGFYPFTAGVPKFYDIGSEIIDILNGGVQEVAMDWTPPTLPPGEGHGCVLVTIDYGYDSDFSNGSNFAQKNLRIDHTSSPASLSFRVHNTLGTKANIKLAVKTRAKNWTVKLSDDEFTMEPYGCARKVEFTAEPGPNVEPGTEALFFVSAFARTGRLGRPVEIGGVAVKAVHRKGK